MSNDKRLESLPDPSDSAEPASERIVVQAVIERVGESEQEYRYSFQHTEMPPAMTEAFATFLRTTFGVDPENVEGSPAVVPSLADLPQEADPSRRPTPPTTAELQAIFARRGGR